MSNDHNVTMGGYADLPPEQRPSYVPPTSQTTSPGVQYAPPLTVQSAPWSYTATPSELAQMPLRNIPTSYTGSAGGYSYAKLPEGIRYTAKPVAENKPPSSYTATTKPQQLPLRHGSTTAPYPESMPLFPQGVPPPLPGPPPAQSLPYGQSASYRQSPPLSQQAYNTKEVTPSGGKLNAPPSPSMRAHRPPMNGQRPDMGRLGTDMNRLTVGGVPPPMPGQLPPGSPLLASYHGTYQDMPSPMMLARDRFD
ncbi:hypothetical protein LTS18_010547, partial [Coniosporium uncinatum]